MSRPRRPAHPVGHHYPRMARVNQVLREVLADALEVEAGSDHRLELVTVTAVECDPDLRHATVLMASLPDGAGEALADVRPRLQAAIAREVRIRRTPLLSFKADPAVAYGDRVESILRVLRSQGELAEDEDEAADVGPIADEGSGLPDQGGPAPAPPA